LSSAAAPPPGGAPRDPDTPGAPGHRVWYLRRSGRQAGPFDSATVRRLLLRRQVELDDEVSLDRKTWQPVATVAEVVPPQLRSGTTPVEFPTQRRPLPLWGMLGFVLVVGGGIGFAFWWGGNVAREGPDCHAAPAPGVDWQGCRLTGLQAAGSRLSGLQAQNADLAAAALAAADLSAAQLDYASLRGADLGYAVLRAASLRGADLREADLTRADLSGADLSYAELSGARVTGVILTGTRLDGAIWTDRRTCAPGAVGDCAGP
jgi:hypothetical protein